MRAHRTALRLQVALRPIRPSTQPLRTLTMASAKLQSFLTDFYRLSDSRCEPEEYAARFAGEGQLEGFAIGPMKLTQDPKDILAWRSKAWDLVTSRRHRVLEVYPKAGKEDEDFVILGDLLNDKKDGTKAYTTWAGQMKVDQSSGKILYYKVWLTAEPEVPAS